MTAPEIALPELDGKTAKMYRGGNNINNVFVNTYLLINYNLN